MRRILLVLAFLFVASPAMAGQAPSPRADGSLPAFEGPSAPVAPETMNRNAAGRATVRATRLTQPLRIDGALDEALYRELPAMNGFIQIEPQPGQPAADDTDVWVTFDGDNVYVSARCWDRDISRVIATEMRRDSARVFTSDDAVLFLFDTFYDRRNAFTFVVNPIEGINDGQVSNERQYNGDFNPVWEVKTATFDKGWTFEAAIPFKSLRYRPGQAQIWGFNFERLKPGTNEISFLVQMPPARGRPAYQQVSLAATLVGIEAPPPGVNLTLKPYVTSNLNTDTSVRPRISNDPGADVGFDVKYAATAGLTADFTVNTDFAQVEADEQQVNLTRFSLFFPEKRDFFLENSGIFAFGGVTSAATSDAPMLFYSRRIGLNRGATVPLNAGGRLTGRVGPFTLGVVNIQTGEEERTASPSTNFSVVRLRRDVLRRSSVGLIATRRSIMQSGQGENYAYGVDATFGFFSNTLVNTYWAKTQTPGVRDKDASFRLQVDYPGDRYGLQAEHLVIGDNFNPDAGFVRRDDMERDYVQLRFSPRPRANRPIARLVRKWSIMGSVEHIANTAGRLESREQLGEAAIEFQNGDRVAVEQSSTYEFLPAPFAIAPGVRLPVGSYSFHNTRLIYNQGTRRTNSFNLSVERGTFYNGHKTSAGASRGRMTITNQLSLEPTYTINQIELEQGSFTTHLAGTRITYTMTPLMFTSALLQYNSGSNSVSVNARLRWEYRPGSELFVVYNEQRDTRVPDFPGLANRALIFKVNRLLRF